MADTDITEFVTEALEAARRAVLERVLEGGHPSSITEDRPVLVPNEAGDGWSIGEEQATYSGITDFSVMMSIRDDSFVGSGVPKGVRDCLWDLAEHLAANSDLGRKREFGFLPQMEGPEGVMHRVLAPMTMHYLGRLPELAAADPGLAAQIAQDLVVHMESPYSKSIQQLAVTGMAVSGPMGHNAYRIRMLTPEEQGAYSMASTPNLDQRSHSMDFVVPQMWRTFMPTSLIEAECDLDERGIARVDNMARFVLALLLSDIPMGSEGTVVEVGWPRWASIGTRFSSLPIGDRQVPTTQLDEVGFRAVADMAAAIPPFGLADATRDDIVYGRVLRGLGSREPSLLDLVIALESVLLPKIQTELQYRFALNGATLLRDSLPPLETFARLKKLYHARSQVVHGEVLKLEQAQEARSEAATLARAVTREVIRSGYPDISKMEGRLLGVDTTEDMA